MNATIISFKKLPLGRLLAAFITGILLEWHCKVAEEYIRTFFLLPILLLIGIRMLPLSKRFSTRWAEGILILLLFILSGALITYTQNITHDPAWYKPSDDKGQLLVTILEPPVTKPRSYKTLAAVHAVNKAGKWYPCKANILIYCKKDNAPSPLVYGTQLIINKPLQPIRNSGNPGAFDYKRYCLFHAITAQVYLKDGDYSLLPDKNINPLQEELYSLRQTTIRILQQYLPGKKEQGVAEALLIGFRDDLDKDLVKAYSNTGVVHIIAISGLHLGMIYGLMIWLFGFFSKYSFTRWVKPLTVLFVLWTFTLVAGAVPSILRSAVMFSFIVIGEMLDKRSNIYNTLAASAFCMLAADPFLLWDVGFLLSYAAVLSIVMFARPVYGWLYYKNKLLDKLWQLSAVTISAQVFTVPVVVFYFHQFPNFFLITNFVAVPLSGLILYGEIILLCLAMMEPLAKFTGNVLSYLLQALNTFIENINVLPVAVWDNIQLSAFETWLLLGVFAGVAAWLMYTSSKAFVASLYCAAIFSITLSADYCSSNKQHKLIVYNVPKYAASDILCGSSYIFSGDSILWQDETLKNFHLTPSRILYRANTLSPKPPLRENCISKVDGKRILLLGKSLPRQYTGSRMTVDILILTHNPALYINQLTQVFDAKMIVFDGSNPLWKIDRWKKDCESLHLRFHSVTDNGAYVVDL